MRAPSKKPLQQWHLLRTYDNLIEEKQKRGYPLREILPALGISEAYYYKYKTPIFNKQNLK